MAQSSMRQSLAEAAAGMGSLFKRQDKRSSVDSARSSVVGPGGRESVFVDADSEWAQQQMELEGRGDGPPGVQNQELLEFEHEEGPSLRDRVHGILDGKVCQISFLFITIFALFGDDLRVRFFYRDDDETFAFLFFLCFVAFAVELTIASIVNEDYKGGFFFFLDLTATISLVPDIPWLLSPIETMMDPDASDDGGVDSGDGSMARAGRASRAGTRAGRIMRLVRLVRVLRMVQFYKFLNRSKKSDLDEQAPVSGDGDKNKRVEASRLGKILSEQTTRRVIVGVLCMLFVLPQLEVTKVDRAPDYGLENLFWVGRSPCGPMLNFTKTAHSGRNELLCDEDNNAPWVTEEGWNFMVYEFAMMSREIESEKSGSSGDPATIQRPLLSLRVPDPFAPQPGTIRSFDEIVTTRCPENPVPDYPFSVPDDSGFENYPESPCPAETPCCWKANKPCQGTGPGADCPWRAAELIEVRYDPPMCLLDESSCRDLFIQARFLDRQSSEVLFHR